MANTYALIKKTEAVGGETSIVFDNIPQTYTDLLICHSLRTNRGSIHESILMRFNGLTTNQSNRRVYATSNLNLTTDTIMYGGQANGSTNTPSTSFGISTVYISAYTTSQNKVSLEWGGSEASATSTLRDINANKWNSSNPITSISLIPENGGTIQVFSTAYLYGIKNS